MTVKEWPVLADGSMVSPRKEAPELNLPEKNKLDSRPPPMAFPLSKGKAPKPRAMDSPSPTDGVGGRAVLATRRRVRLSQRSLGRF